MCVCVYNRWDHIGIGKIWNTDTHCSGLDNVPLDLLLQGAQLTDEPDYCALKPKATFPRGWSQPVTKRDLFLVDAWLLVGDCLKDSPLAWFKLELYHYLRPCFPLPSPLHRAQTCIAIQWFSSSPITHSSLSLINLCTSNPRLASVSWSTQNNTKQQWLPRGSESICNFFFCRQYYFCNPHMLQVNVLSAWAHRRHADSGPSINRAGNDSY